MISYSNIERGLKIIINGQPYEILQTSSMFKGRGHSTLQAKLRNLISGEIISRTFHPSDSFAEAEISKITCEFVYNHKDNYFFCEHSNTKNRFSLDKKQLGNAIKFLKPGIKAEGLIFENKIISIKLPIKVHLKAKEAPPGIKGDRSQAGTKLVKLETGGEINVPLFINQDDLIEVNTETEEYVRRIEKK